MFAFIVRRLLLTIPVVWIVVTLVFGFIHMVPGDPVAQMLGEGASVTQVERLRHELGLDRPERPSMERFEPLAFPDCRPVDVPWHPGAESAMNLHVTSVAEAELPDIRTERL